MKISDTLFLPFLRCTENLDHQRDHWKSHIWKQGISSTGAPVSYENIWHSFFCDVVENLGESLVCRGEIQTFRWLHNRRFSQKAWLASAKTSSPQALLWRFWRRSRTALLLRHRRSLLRDRWLKCVPLAPTASGWSCFWASIYFRAQAILISNGCWLNIAWCARTESCLFGCTTRKEWS